MKIMNKNIIFSNKTNYFNKINNKFKLNQIPKQRNNNLYTLINSN